MSQEKDKGKDVDPAHQLAGLRISPPSRPAVENDPPQPSRPTQEPEDEPDLEDDDENNPFGDSNAIETPAQEKGEPDWGKAFSSFIYQMLTIYFQVSEEDNDRVIFVTHCDWGIGLF